VQSNKRRLAGTLVAGALLTMFVLAVSASASNFGAKQFQSPSKNIGCVIVKAPKSQGGGEARCDIAEHSWTAPPKPQSCQLDWGFGVVVGEHGKANYVCAGDTALHQGHVLHYGDSIEYAHFKCKSNTTSMRCHSKKSGHGFSLSRERVNFF
jgi:uncharacterized protein DUF6636